MGRVASKLKSRPRYAVIKPLCAVEKGHRHPKAELRAYKAFLVAEVTVDGVSDASAATAVAAKLLKVGAGYGINPMEGLARGWSGWFAATRPHCVGVCLDVKSIVFKRQML